jgi:3-oxoacyl-[acyl-carrier-protein] synthase I
MKRPLYIAGAGAVTPGGLNVRQTVSAIRASLSAVEDMVLTEPFGAVQVVSRIPTHWKLKRTEGDWLANMAARAIKEAMAGSTIPSEATAILLSPPESFRAHPAFEDIAASAFLAAVIERTGRTFHPSSRSVDGGAAANVGLVERAAELIGGDSGVEQIVLGGVDSLINDPDLARLGAAGRLKGDENAQGLVPGEGAVFVRLTSVLAGDSGTTPAIYGVGVAQEQDSVLSERYSQGRAMLAALRGAVAGAGPSEPDVSFVLSSGNGERYGGLESLIARPRFYKTRREPLIVAYPAMTVGDIGAAAGALSLMLAADSISNGYAPGPVAMCEASSEGGLRAAAIVAAMSSRRN